MKRFFNWFFSLFRVQPKAEGEVKVINFKKAVKQREKKDGVFYFRTPTRIRRYEEDGKDNVIPITKSYTVNSDITPPIIDLGLAKNNLKQIIETQSNINDGQK